MTTPEKSSPRPGRRAANTAVGVAGLAALTLVLSGCGNDQQAATTSDSSAQGQPSAAAEGSPGATPAAGPLLTVDKPAPAAPDLTGAANCPGAVRINDNKHNICATWVNDAPVFTGPGVLSNATANFDVRRFDANGTSTHHVSHKPDPFGPSTWGATSAATGYGASMDWTFGSAQPQDTINGSATQDSDDGHTATCGASTGQYLLCAATSTTMTQIDGNRVNVVAYDIVNAPLTVQVVNNTGKPMAATGKPTLDRLQSSTAGSASTASISPAQSATFGLFRASGQSASFRVTFAFDDASDTQIKHNVTVTAQAKLVNAGQPDYRLWGMDTAGSSCVDNPSSGSAAPATCSLGWSGNTSWFGSAAMTVYVSNS